MAEIEKEKDKFVAVVAPEAPPAPAQPPASAPAKIVSAPDDDSSGAFFAEPLVGFDASEIAGTLIVIEGMDGSGRSTQISLLQEWLESEGFAVQTSGLRRSNLVGRDIDQLLAKNAVTRLTLALMYCTDFFDQLEHRIVPALKSGAVVLADRYIFTLIARSVVRGINRDYLSGLYAMALRPHLTFWLNVRPETVSRWNNGKALPHASTERQLLELEFIVDKLADIYEPRDARLWLFSRQRLLQDHTPAELIQGGHVDEVLAAVNQLLDGAHL